MRTVLWGGGERGDFIISSLCVALEACSALWNPRTELRICSVTGGVEEAGNRKHWPLWPNAGTFESSPTAVKQHVKFV